MRTSGGHGRLKTRANIEIVNMRIFLIILNLIGVSNLGYSQDTVVYRYVGRGMCGFVQTGERKSFRIILQDSSFIDSNIINKSNFHFKIGKGGNWYIKDKNKWKLFYSVKKGICNVVLRNSEYKIQFLDNHSKAKFGLYSFAISPKNIDATNAYDFGSHWFHSKHGIICYEEFPDDRYFRDDINWEVFLRIYDDCRQYW